MLDYKQGKIYTIRCETDDTLIYVGFTTQSLCVRMAKHTCDSVKDPNRHFSPHIDDWDNWYIELFEDFPCDSKGQLNKREGEFIREIGTVNKQITGRTQKENKIDNKSKIKKNIKKYMMKIIKIV
jgi:hypothetical protein